jgi:hypothetical protein
MTNLIADVMKMASPALIDKASQSLGINADIIKGVMGGAVPGVLGAVVNKATMPGGINDILGGLKQANPDVGGSLASVLTGKGAGDFAAQGSSLLNSMLGQGVVGALVSAVAKNAGTSTAVGSTLMGLVGQMVMGTLAKNASGLDAGGLMSLLNSQKGVIQAALPAGFGAALGTLGSTADAAKAAAAKVTTQASHTANTAMREAQAASGGGFVKWLIPLALLAGAAWYFLSPGAAPTVTEAPAPAAPATEQAAPAPAPAAPAATEQAQPAAPAVPAVPAVPAAPSLVIDNVDVGTVLNTAFTGLTGALGGITDVASAQAALPKLQEAAGAVDQVSGVAGKFSADQKAMVGTLIKTALPGLNDTITKVEAIPGVGDLVKPVIDGIIAKLAALAG